MKRILILGMVVLLAATSVMISLTDNGNGEVTNTLFDNKNQALTGGIVNIPGGAGMDSQYSFKVAKNVPISEAYLNISTHDAQYGSTPQDPYVDVGVDSNVEWTYSGRGYGKFGDQRYFSDDLTRKSLSFGSSGGSNSGNNILLPANTEVIDADMGVRGRFLVQSLSDYQIEKDPAVISLNGFAMENGDLDKDGDIDVVISDVRNSRIIWLENPNSTDKAWTMYTVASGSDVTNCYSVDIGDIDGDGDLDIAASSYSRNYIMWYRNDNKAKTWIRFLFHTSFPYAGRVRIADIDQDGNPDIVAITYYFYYWYNYGTFVWWFEAPDNPCINGSTSSGGSSSYWRYRSIASNPTYYYYSYLAMDVDDVNGDGYPDVVFATYPAYWYYYCDYLYVFLNPKSLTSSWSGGIKDSSAGQIYSLEIADIDGDKMKDIVTATYGSAAVRVYKNNNNASSWSKQTLLSYSYPRRVLIEDLNDDGKMDLIVGGGSGMYDFSVYYQGSSYLSYTKYLITTALIDPLAFTNFDKDHDNDTDFMVAGYSGSQLVMVNTTSKTTPSHQVIWIADGGIKDVIWMDPIDMDGDRDQDIVFIAYGTGYVGWWENDGTPFDTTGKLYRIGSLGNPYKVMCADVDGDGDKDVVVLNNGGVLYWFERPVDPKQLWSGYLISTGISGPYGLFAGDYTGDGKADVIVSSTSGYIRIHKAPTDPRTPNWNWNYVATGLSYLRNVWGDDVDRDGDLDVLTVYGTYGSGVVALYKNPLGMKDPLSGNWGAVGIGSGLYYPEDVKSIDITDDKWPDVVITGWYYYSDVKWFQNPWGGQCSGWIGRQLYSGAYDWNLAVGDIGNDGYADIVFNRGSTSGPSQIIWLEEPVDYTGTWSQYSIASYSTTWGLAIVDLDGDEIAEILSVGRSRDEIRAWKINAIFPTNVGLDIGADETANDWYRSGTLKGNTSIDITAALQEIIDSRPSSVGLSPDKYGTPMLTIPLEISSATTGRVQMEDIRIRYNTTVTVKQNGEGLSLAKVLDRLIPDYSDGTDPALRIFIGVGAGSSGSLYIDSLKVEYNAIPKQVDPLPAISVDEDSTTILPFDLANYFTDDYTSSAQLDYDIVLIGPKADRIQADILNRKIVLDSTVTKDFNTRMSEPYDIMARIVVTDKGGPNGVPERKFVTKDLPVIVNRVNDYPVRSGGSLPILYAMEGNSTVVTDLDDHDLFFDVDGDKLMYQIICDLSSPTYDTNASFKIDISNTGEIIVSLNEASDWTGRVQARLYAFDSPYFDYTKSAQVDFVVVVNNSNDGPVWKPIPSVEMSEDTEVSRIAELTSFVSDIDTPKTGCHIDIVTYSNRSFIKPGLEVLTNGQTYLNMEPLVENWNGECVITLLVSDGEFSSMAEMTVNVLPVNDKPWITISEPPEDGRIDGGRFLIAGEAYDVEGIVSIEIMFQDKWERTTVSNNWGMTLTAPKVDHMLESVPLMARVFDGEEYAYAYVNVTILEYEPPIDLDLDDDGHQNIADAFPYDPSEWSDRDNDKVGDNTDDFPDDQQWWSDLDKDGIADQADTHPYDPSLWNDKNGDGRNDELPPISRVKGENDEEKNYVPIALLWVLAGIALVITAVALVMFVGKRNATKDPRRMAKYYAKQQRWRSAKHNIMERLPLARMLEKVPDMLGLGTVHTPQPAPMPGRQFGPSPVGARPFMPAPRAAMPPPPATSYRSLPPVQSMQARPPPGPR